MDDIKQKRNKKEREQILAYYLQNVTFSRDFSVVYMFYDTDQEKPCIFEDEAYDKTFKECVIECIV